MNTLTREYVWHIEDSPGDESGIYRDIYQGEVTVAERVIFDDAEAMVLRHNRNLKELASDIAQSTVYRKSSYRKSLDSRKGKTCAS
jgi:hypothetical protein